MRITEGMISRLVEVYELEYVGSSKEGKKVLANMLSKAYERYSPGQEIVNEGQHGETWKYFDKDCEAMFGKPSADGKLKCDINTQHSGDNIVKNKSKGYITIQPTENGGFEVGEYDSYTTVDKFAQTNPFTDHKVKESISYTREGLAMEKKVKTWTGEPTTIAGKMLSESIDYLIGECTTVERVGGVFARVTTDPFYLDSRSNEAKTITTTLNSEYGYNRLYTTGRDDTTYAEVSGENPNTDTLYHFGKAVARGLEDTAPELRGLIESQMPNRIKEAAGLNKEMGE
ncbi:MAG: hypothetical protein E7361_04045 [Clostridiales bacterium]|nr:hypothetical protein [Clostridiales bacterium]